MKNEFAPDQRFCCAGFQNRVADAGERGLAVLVVNDANEIGFRLQSRGIAFQDERKIKPMPDAPDYHINISCETGMNFCPFCGRRLQELTEAAPIFYARLAKKHKQFYFKF